jgi:ribonuclease J
MEVCCVGGYEEVGKNMTAVKVNEDVFLFDMGFYLPGVIELQENPDIEYTTRGLRRVGGIPDDRVLDKNGWREKVRGIFISHAHLDHVGGVPFLADRYPDVPVYGTAFTIEVLKSLIEDSNIHIRNRLIVVDSNSTVSIPNCHDNAKVEFVHATHSTIDCTYVALHSKEGTFFYALDLKLDNHPTMGAPPNYSRLKEIGENGVKILVIDSLYSGTEKKPGGEKVADHLLEEAFSKTKNTKGRAFFVTTFSSHIERLNNIVKYAEKTGREIVFLGRSLAKYVECANKVGKCPFRKKIKIAKYRGQVNSILKHVDKNPERYIVVCTGHQGEKGSILDRIARGETPFRFTNGDNLIFSSSIIPTEVNIEARKKLDIKLRRQGVKLQSDVHVHGHGSREDLREMLELLKPKHVIPAHGSLEQETPMIDLAKEYGYRFGKTSHLASDGKFFKF